MKVGDGRTGRSGELERLVGSRTAPVRAVQRARIVLLSAEVQTAAEIAQRVGGSEQTVGAVAPPTSSRVWRGWLGAAAGSPAGAG